MTQIEFGTTAKDKITGFTGVVTGRAQYISDCSQILLAPPVKDGDFRDSQWFDEQRVEAIAGAAQIVLDNGSHPGPDKPAPKR